MTKLQPSRIHEARNPAAIIVAGRRLPVRALEAHKRLQQRAEELGRDLGTPLVCATLSDLQRDSEASSPALVGILLASHTDPMTAQRVDPSSWASELEVADELLGELWDAAAEIWEAPGSPHEVGASAIYIGQVGLGAAAALASGKLEKNVEDDEEWLEALIQQYGDDRVHAGSSDDWSEVHREAVVGEEIAQSSWLFHPKAAAPIKLQKYPQSLYLLLRNHDG